MSDAERIVQIRSWRDQTRDVYGVPHERGDSDLVCNNKAWWADADTLLRTLDKRPSCGTCKHWRHVSPDSSSGLCEAVTEVSDGAWLDTYDGRLHLCTTRDHGCTAHEEGVNAVAAFVARPSEDHTP